MNAFKIRQETDFSPPISLFLNDDATITTFIFTKLTLTLKEEEWYWPTRMYPSIRRYATISPDKAVRFGKKTLTLEHFLQRQKVINLWRDCVRTINSM